jgi:hypothetical protein
MYFASYLRNVTLSFLGTTDTHTLNLSSNDQLINCSSPSLKMLKAKLAEAASGTVLLLSLCDVNGLSDERLHSTAA